MPPVNHMPPERKMIVVAVMFAILEAFTTILGTLNIIWATTVLLGAYADSLSRRDFWYVSIILVAEGIRIFGRKGDLHTSSYFLDTRIFSVPAYAATCSLCSALICYFLTGIRFGFFGSGSQNFQNLDKAQNQNLDKAHNLNLALTIFYLVSIVETFLILVGYSRIVTTWHTAGCGLRCIRRGVLDVKEKCGLDDSQIPTLYRFFHYTYSQSVRGSILDSSNMTIVSYSVELLQSSNGNEQLRGATLLSALVKGNTFSLERLTSIEAIRGAVVMLIDMLNLEWNINPGLVMERLGIRRAAAEIISNLVKIRRNRTLVMAAPGSMESIASLLYDGNRAESSHEYPYLDFSELGLRILKGLANDHDNRAKMGSNRGLLLKIITLTESKSCERLELKILAIKTLTSIARDQDLRESIGCTDGVLHNLFSLFFMKNYNLSSLFSMNINDNKDPAQLVRIRAGEALGFLSLDDNQNCKIMKSIRRAYFRNLIPSLISVLNDRERGTYAARILRNLSAGLEANSVELNAIIEASEQVVGIVMEREGMHQEAAIGLAAQIFSKSDFGERGAEIERSLISKLRDVLQQHAIRPSKELPNIRRFSILLLIAVIERMGSTIAQGSQLETDLKNALEGAMNTTTALESCSTLSGGLRSDSMAIPFLAQYAMQLLHNKSVEAEDSVPSTSS